MIRFLASVLFGLVVMSSAGAQALRKPVEYPGTSFPEPVPGGGRVTYIQPGQAANGARFSGGAISDIGTLRLSTFRPSVPVPAQMRLTGGASRVFGRGLLRISPALMAAGLAAWLTQEGISKCKASGGMEFWCLSTPAEFRDRVWTIYTHPNTQFGTPDAAHMAYWGKYPPTDRLVTNPCFKDTTETNGKWLCWYGLYGTSGSLLNKLISQGHISVYELLKPGSNNNEPVPAQDADVDRVADRHPIAPADVQAPYVIDPNADALVNASPVPLPVTNPSFAPGFVPAAEVPAPYPCAAFASKSCLDGYRVTAAPGPDCPNCANITPVTVDATNTEAVKPVVAGDVTTPTTGQNTGTTVDKQKDPCELNPSRLGCMQLGEDEGKQVPKKDKALSFTAESVGLPAGCPADIPGPSGKPGISYASACEAAAGARPVVVALGAMAALLIVLAAVRSS